MQHITLEKNIALHIHFIGIKGSGMASLALLFAKLGASISGSDTPEVFYTDDMLRNAGISWNRSFNKKHIPSATDLIICSDAWNHASHPEVAEAKRRGLLIHSYSQVLGILSASTFSVAVAGVHGKTSTTAILALLCDALELPVTAIVGGALQNFQHRSMLFRGTQCFIAETCEYRENFLHFHPDILLITSIERDHTDYFPTYEDIFQAFLSYSLTLPKNGVLVYCSDDSGARHLAARCRKLRSDIKYIAYGKSASGAYKIQSIQEHSGMLHMHLASQGNWQLPFPSAHSLVNTAGAIAVLESICKRLQLPPSWEKMKSSLLGFRGIKRRSEIIGRSKGITIVDDYAHHPTAIQNTLEGFRRFFACRTLIVDFMPHTYSRTEVLLEEFSQCFNAADEVIINDIYGSARETQGRIQGNILAETIALHHAKVSYEACFHKVVASMQKKLQRGDLFVTMGAGNNWEIGYALHKALEDSP